MKKAFKIGMGVLFLFALIGTFVFLWNKTRPEKVVYSIVTPHIDTIEKRVIATGKLEPRDEVLIKPQVSGIISELNHKTGDRIHAGEIIARIKVIPEMVSLNEAKSQLNMAKINEQQYRREHNRINELFASGVVSKEEFEQSETALSKAVEQLQNAKDNLEIMEHGIAARNVQMTNTQVRSTIEGVILDIPVKVGSSVIMSNAFNDGTTIASVADMGDMIFDGKVDETEVGKLTKGMPVVISIGALQNVKLNATLEYIAPKGEDENGIILFEIKAEAKIPSDLTIRAGYSANADIVTDRREGVITIPEGVVEFDGEKSFVQLLTSSKDAPTQTFERKEVKLGLSNGINIEVLEGITLEDQLRGEKETKKKQENK